LELDVGAFAADVLQRLWSNGVVAGPLPETRTDVVEVELDEPELDRGSAPRTSGAGGASGGVRWWLLAATAGVAVFATVLASVLWPRGDERSSLGLRVPDQVGLQWEAEVDVTPIYDVVASDELVVVAAGFDSTLIGIDAASGEQRWRTVAAPGRVDQLGVVDGVVIGTSRGARRTGLVFGIDAVSGERLWSRFLDTDDVAQVNRSLLVTHHGARPSIAAVDASTGRDVAQVPGLLVAPTWRGESGRPVRLFDGRLDVLEAVSLETVESLELDAVGLGSESPPSSVHRSEDGYTVALGSTLAWFADGKLIDTVELDRPEFVVSVSDATIVTSAGGDDVSGYALRDGQLTRIWTMPGFAMTSGSGADPGVIYVDQAAGDGSGDHTILLVDASSGRVVWESDDRLVHPVELGDNGYVLATEASGSDVASAVTGHANDGRQLWRLEVEPFSDTYLLDDAITTTFTDISTGVTTLRLFR
jgi:outer membrane protein assembly factor BamB